MKTGQIQINEIFRSISGEAGTKDFPQGCLCTFVRLQGCNLKCSWCFGAPSGKRNPKLSYSKTANKKITEAQIGDLLMTFDTAGHPVETEITNVIKREVDRWLRITIENVQYFVTEEHPFFTNRGMIPASELVKGDMIIHSSPMQKVSFQKTLYNPMKNPTVAKRSGENTDYTKTGKAISKTIQKKKKEGTYVAAWDKLSKDQKTEAKRKISIANSGENNGNWGGGLNKNRDELKTKIKSGKITKCAHCKCVPDKEIKPGQGIGLDVHHIDCDDTNDAKSNLRVLCDSCHYSFHQMGYNFWKGDRKDNKSIKPRNGKQVQKIKLFDRAEFPPSTRPKKLTVYNISCAPYNTYLIDNMWVHNCDTEQSQSDNEGIWKSLQEIQQACTGTRRVLITGGEPLTQEKPLLDLIFNLLTKGHVVQVETNGSIPIPYAPALSSGLSWVLDYKMPSSGMHNKMMNSLLFFEAITRRNAIIKFVYDNLDDVIVTFDKMKLLKVMYSMKGIKPDFPPFVLSPTVNARSLDIMIDHKKIIERIFKEGLQEFCMVSVQSHKILDLK